jgi:hypothetical protein
MVTLLVVLVAASSFIHAASRSDGTETTNRTGFSERRLTPARPPAIRRDPRRSIYSERDRALMAAVAAGLVPEEALETDHFLILSLVNQGLIPREAAEPRRGER